MIKKVSKAFETETKNSKASKNNIGTQSCSNSFNRNRNNKFSDMLNTEMSRYNTIKK